MYFFLLAQLFRFGFLGGDFLFRCLAGRVHLTKKSQPKKLQRLSPLTTTCRGYLRLALVLRYVRRGIRGPVSEWRLPVAQQRGESYHIAHGWQGLTTRIAVVLLESFR